MKDYHKVKHRNHSGRCSKCIEIFNVFPDFNEELKAWFWLKHTELGNTHISEAGRSEFMQEKLYKEKKTKAHYGQSAHNFNMAIDIFFIDDKGKLSYEKQRYTLLTRDLPTSIKWYGEPGSFFYELPHFEIRDWRNMGDRKLVEEV